MYLSKEYVYVIGAIQHYRKMIMIMAMAKQTVQIMLTMTLPVLIAGTTCIIDHKKVKPFSEIIPGESSLGPQSLKLISPLIAPSGMGLPICIKHLCRTVILTLKLSSFKARFYICGFCARNRFFASTVEREKLEFLEMTVVHEQWVHCLKNSVCFTNSTLMLSQGALNSLEQQYF